MSYSLYQFVSKHLFTGNMCLCDAYSFSFLFYSGTSSFVFELYLLLHISVFSIPITLFWIKLIGQLLLFQISLNYNFVAYGRLFSSFKILPLIEFFLNTLFLKVQNISHLLRYANKIELKHKLC